MRNRRGDFDDEVAVLYSAKDAGVRDETCLISPDRDYFILNGDFRKEYEELLPLGYIKCYQFFLNNQDKKSSWSN